MLDDEGVGVGIPVGVLDGEGVGVGFGAATFIATPLFQISFLPLLIQV